jgi:phosphate transport system protein
MGLIARGMLATALEAFLAQSVALAESVLVEDDRLDQLKDQVFRELLTYMLGDSRTIEPSLDLLLISRHLERIGDHATNIAEDVIFIVEARDVRHGFVGPITATANVPGLGTIAERRRNSSAEIV